MSSTLAYLDPASGIAGDMFLGCLVSVGWRMEALEQTIRDLAWEQAFDHSAWSVSRQAVMKGPFHATLINVQATEQGQPHRHLSDIRALLEKSRLPAPVIESAIAVFTHLAEAESVAHGIAVEQVHFHEVGALDSIIDIVGVCAGMHELGLTLHSAPLPLGHGYAQTEHGMTPLPAPATLELMARANAPIKPAPGPGELVTPTGAALVIHFTENRWFQPDMRLQKIGIGAGTWNFAWPNVARLWVGDSYNARRAAYQAAVAPAPTPPTHSHSHASAPAHSHGTPLQDHHSHGSHDTAAYTPKTSSVVSDTPHSHASDTHTPHAHSGQMSLLETNIDDMNPEFYAAISEKLFANGARDVWYSSIFMKKNRPGIKLSVLVRAEDEARLAKLLLRDSSTLGMRVLPVGRYEAERRMDSVTTPFGDIPVKLKIMDGEVVGAVPEYDPCKAAAQAYGISTREVYEAAASLAWWSFIAPKHAGMEQP
jgi:uncharacterized protein (TIGR00299 family) protein